MHIEVVSKTPTAKSDHTPLLFIHGAWHGASGYSGCTDSGMVAREGLLNPTIGRTEQEGDMKKWFARLRDLSCLFVVAAVISAVLLMPIDSPAAQDIPNVIIKGLADYQSSGPDAAVKTWLKGSALESSPEAQSQANVFRQIEAMYGKYVGYHVIKIKELTPTCTLAFLTLDYEKGPLFAYFTAYKNADQWIIANMNYNTKAEAVLPESVISQ